MYDNVSSHVYVLECIFNPLDGTPDCIAMGLKKLDIHINRSRKQHLTS